MRSFIRVYVTAVILVGMIIGASVASVHASGGPISTDTISNSSFRSAFLGPDVWEDDLSSAEIKQQLQNHFAHVIQRLESTHASSLLRALIRAEATAGQRWTQSQRREALVLLATNRRRQIARLRYYMNRGLFPQNEGQSASAVPIFVDRHQTHCAVGFLMHSDGRDQAIASIVQKNNFVYVNDVHSGGLIDWIRSSGLTQEEAALIQPGYPISGVTRFSDLSAPNATLEQNGFVVSGPTYRSHFFDVTLPADFQGNPAALQDVFDLGRAGVESSIFNSSPFAGFMFGNQFNSAQSPFGDPLGTAPDNLDESLYVGTDSSGIFVGLANTFSNQAAIVEIEYMLRSEQGNFSQIALSSTGGTSTVDEQSASMILSEIYDGNTDALLGETQLSLLGPGSLNGTDSIELDTNFVRIKTQSLIVGDAEFSSFFNEFATSAVPEPCTGSILILVGAIAANKRRRKVISK